jgi:tripartite motif-containing protein 33
MNTKIKWNISLFYSYKRVLLTSAMKVIDDRQSLIVEKKKALVKEITAMVVK